MENQPFLTPSRGELGEALLRLCYGTEEHVKAGYYCAITICSINGQQTCHVPRRVLVWLLLNLGPQMTECQLGAVAKGHARRLEYRDINNEAYVLGTYSLADSQAFVRGIRDYAIKNNKLARREVRFIKVESERLRLENDFLRGYLENRDAYALFVQEVTDEIEPQPQPALTYEQALFACVVAGQAVAFTVHYEDGEESRTITSQRAAVWLLKALEGREAGELVQGETVRIDYQYGAHCAALGTYLLRELVGFYRGKRDYCKRKYKDAMRRVQHKKRLQLAAEKGGAAL